MFQTQTVSDNLYRCRERRDENGRRLNALCRVRNHNDDCVVRKVEGRVEGPINQGIYRSPRYAQIDFLSLPNIQLRCIQSANKQ